MPPRPQHRTQFGRDYRRVYTSKQNRGTGTGAGGGGSGAGSHIVREEDGTSKLILEEGTFFLLTEEST